MPTRTFYSLGSSNEKYIESAEVKNPKPVASFRVLNLRKMFDAGMPSKLLHHLIHSENPNPTSDQAIDPIHNISQNLTPKESKWVKIKSQNLKDADSNNLNSNLNEAEKLNQAKIEEIDVESFNKNFEIIEQQQNKNLVSVFKNLFHKSKKVIPIDQANLSKTSSNNEIPLQSNSSFRNTLTSESAVRSGLQDSSYLNGVIFEATLKIEQKYRKFIYGLVSLFLLLIVLNLYTVFYLSFSNRAAPSVSVETKSVTPNLQQFKTPETGVKSIKEFAGNAALGDVGFQLEVQKNQIKTKGSQNCKTPILPPMENGCHFLLIPSTLGIPTRGMIYYSLSIDADIASGDKIQVDIKNYDKDKIESVGTINSANSKDQLILPESISSSSGILFRLWAKNDNITIRSINLKYFAVEDLKEVSGSLDGELGKIAEGAKIYLDVNQNGKLEAEIDKSWVCRPNFPGATFNPNTDGTFTIEPDDGCFVDVKPDCWYKSKTSKCALPVAKYILVFEKKELVIPFVVKEDTKNLVLGMK